MGRVLFVVYMNCHMAGIILNRINITPLTTDVWLPWVYIAEMFACDSVHERNEECFLEHFCPRNGSLRCSSSRVSCENPWPPIGGGQESQESRARAGMGCWNCVRRTQPALKGLLA